MFMRLLSSFLFFREIFYEIFFIRLSQIPFYQELSYIRTVLITFLLRNGLYVLGLSQLPFFQEMVYTRTVQITFLLSRNVQH